MKKIELSDVITYVLSLCFVFCMGYMMYDKFVEPMFPNRYQVENEIRQEIKEEYSMEKDVQRLTALGLRSSMAWDSGNDNVANEAYKEFKKLLQECRKRYGDEFAMYDLTFSFTEAMLDVMNR